MIERDLDQLRDQVATVRFFVAGKVRTNQRHRTQLIRNKYTDQVVGQHQYTPEETGLSRQDYVTAFRAALDDPRAVAGAPLDEALGMRPQPELELPWPGPIRLVYTMTHMRPSSHWPGRFCSRKPDWDNVGKLIGDALNLVAWRDDSQIVDARGVKQFGVIPGVEVQIDFCRELEKPFHGLVKVGDGEYQLYDQGRLLGEVMREGRKWRPLQRYTRDHLTTDALATRAEAVEFLFEIDRL